MVRGAREAPPLGLGKRVAFALALALLCLGAAEAIALVAYGAFDGRRFGYWRVRHEKLALAESATEVQESPGQLAQVFLTVHPYLGFVWSKAANDLEGFPRHHEDNPINDFGFTDASDTIQERSEDKLIVGVVGGSVAWWLSAQGDETLSARLRESAAFVDREIVFVRLAIGGYKQPQQLMSLAYVLSMGGELDVLVNLDGFNEVALTRPLNVRNGINPFYPRQWHLLMSPLPDVESQRRLGRLVYVRDQRREWAATLSGPVARRSILAQLAWRIRDLSLQKRVSEAVVALETYSKGELLSTDVTGPPFAHPQGEALYDDIAEHWARCSLLLHRMCAAEGIAYLHFLQPNQYVEGSKPIAPEEAPIAISENNIWREGVELGYPRLAAAGAALARAGVRFHDLRYVFEDVEQPLYIDDCCHVSRLGNQLLANRIADEILDVLDGGTRLVAFEPADTVVLERPGSEVPLQLRGRYADGEVRTFAVAWPQMSVASADPSVVSVSPAGGLRGWRLGATSVRVEQGELAVDVPVEGRWGAVVAFDDGLVGEDERQPRLAPEGQPAAGARIVLAVEHAPPDAPGLLVASLRPIGADASGLVPGEAWTFPLARSDGAAAATVPIPAGARVRGRALFFRAFFRAPDAPLGWTASNGIALTPR